MGASKALATRTFQRAGIGAALVAVALLILAPSASAAAGSLDSSFDVDGRVTTDLGSAEEAHALAIQPDGKMVVAGITPATDPEDFTRFPVLLRYDTDGSLDGTFDGDGVCFITAPEPTDVAVQSDGKILVAGGYQNDFAVARFDTGCTPDSTFSDDGFQRIDLAGGIEEATGIAVQPDGKIIVVGSRRPNELSGFDFVIARLDTAGTLDSSFSGDGWLRANFGISDRANAVALQSDGKIIVAGRTDGRTFESMDFALARCTAQGTLDAAFSGDGKVRTSFGFFDEAFDVGVQQDGKVVAGGRSSSGEMDFALARYTANGVLDATFSGDGKRRTDFSGGNDEAYGLAIQANGRIIQGGLANPSNGSENPTFALARYRTGGKLDLSFSGDGKVQTRFGANRLDYGRDLALQADGRIVLAGDVTAGFSSNDFGLARYLAE